MKRAEVYYKNNLAGILAETDAGYEFCYIKDYLESKNAEPVSLTLRQINHIIQMSYFHSSTDSFQKDGSLMLHSGIPT